MSQLESELRKIYCKLLYFVLSYTKYRKYTIKLTLDRMRDLIDRSILILLNMIEKGSIKDRIADKANLMVYFLHLIVATIEVSSDAISRHSLFSTS